MGTGNRIEALLSATPRPGLRDGPHRAALKQQLLDRMRETAAPDARAARPTGPAAAAGGFPAPWGDRWRRVARPQWVVAAAAVIVVVVSGGIIVLKRNGGGGSVAQQGPARLATTAPSAGVKAVAVAPSLTATSRPLLEGRGVERLRRKSLDQSVAEAQVIVVATALDSSAAPPHVRGDAPENLIRFHVVRVLKGKLEQEFITTRTPTAPAEFIGRDWVVMLSPENMAGKHAYAGIYGIKFEPEVKAIVDRAAK